jgi:hypothetical protein
LQNSQGFPACNGTSSVRLALSRPSGNDTRKTEPSTADGPMSLGHHYPAFGNEPQYQQYLKSNAEAASNLAACERLRGIWEDADYFGSVRAEVGSAKIMRAEFTRFLLDRMRDDAACANCVQRLSLVGSDVGAFGLRYCGRGRSDRITRGAGILSGSRNLASVFCSAGLSRFGISACREAWHPLPSELGNWSCRCPSQDPQQIVSPQSRENIWDAPDYSSIISRFLSNASASPANCDWRPPRLEVRVFRTASRDPAATPNRQT